jgi:hypothetical protein
MAQCAQCGERAKKKVVGKVQVPYYWQKECL